MTLDIDEHGFIRLPISKPRCRSTEGTDHGHEGLPSHACAYLSDLYEDLTTQCTCCDKCQQACADEL